MITSAHWRHTSIALPRSFQDRKLRIWKADGKRFHTDETFFETHQTDHLRRKNGDAGDWGVLVHLWQEMWRFWQLVFNIGYIPPPQPLWNSSHPSLQQIFQFSRPPSAMVDEQLSYIFWFETLRLLQISSSFNLYFSHWTWYLYSGFYCTGMDISPAIHGGAIVGENRFLF